jgi:ribose 1,5-bisphosphokinase
MQGRLVYVVGASGAGKDSLIRYAREALGKTHRVIFAHRYITRPATSGGENHIELTAPEFAQRKRLGLFAMTWDSHGYRYGIGVEIDAWLAGGLTVVVNGSRGYIRSARRRYPRISVVWISAGPQVLAARLKGRGRESRAEINARLERNSKVGLKPPRGAVEIDNEGSLEDAGRRFVELLLAKA